MDKLRGQIRNYASLLIVLIILITTGTYVILLDVTGSFIMAMCLTLAVGLTLSLLIGWLIAQYALQPLEYLQRAITHVSVDENGPAPDMTELGAGQ